MPSALLYTNNVTLSCATNTTFRSWGGAISEAFSAAGWVKITGIGEVDWSTVAVTGNTSTMYGFEIWRMDDALQATTPVYLRIDYGTSSAATVPALTIQLGTGQTGNVLTGPVTAPAFPKCTGNSSTGSWTSYFCGDTNRIWFVLGPTSANCMLLSIERTHDANGGDTAEGALIMWGNTSTQHSQQYWNGAVGPTGIESSLGALLPGAGLGATGDTVSFFPIYHQRGKFLNPSLNWMIGSSGTVTSLATLNLTFYGATHTYLPLGVTANTRSGSGTLLGMWE